MNTYITQKVVSSKKILIINVYFQTAIFIFFFRKLLFKLFSPNFMDFFPEPIIVPYKQIILDSYGLLTFFLAEL